MHMRLVPRLRAGVGERSEYPRTGASRRNEVLRWLKAIPKLLSVELARLCVGLAGNVFPRN